MRERPDIEVHTICAGAKKVKKLKKKKKKKGSSKKERMADMEKYKMTLKDLSNGKGVEVLFDKESQKTVYSNREARG